MAIKRIQLKDFLVFKGTFTADFSPGINVLIGENGSGKTTLIKALYNSYYLFREESLNFNSKSHLPYFTQVREDVSPKIFYDINGEPYIKETKCDMFELFIKPSEKTDISAVYIPEKDILEHAKGLLTFIEQKQTGFGREYKDVLIAAQDVPTLQQSETQKAVGQKIIDIIGGRVHWDKSDGSFYTIKTDGDRIPFSNEASGYKKLGYLGLLVSSGQLKNGAVLFWDEPENSLNPELAPDIVDILLELNKNSVQIFIATHDYNLARYIDVRKNKNIPALYHNLSKTNERRIICKSTSEYKNISDNMLERANENLFEAVVSNAMGDEDVE